MIVAAVAVTIVLGLTQTSLPPLLDELSERRTRLWREAMEITVREPVFGAGPGMFAQTSPTALADADARWAHSAYLQVAAMLVGLSSSRASMRKKSGLLPLNGRAGAPKTTRPGPRSRVTTAPDLHPGIRHPVGKDGVSWPT